MSEETCETCRFSVVENHTEEFCECRKNSPRPLVTSYSAECGVWWPTTYRTD